MSLRTGTLVSGNEAVAMAALDAGVALGTGYPGTPSTEILEAMDAQGGRSQWAPNEKVALEVAVGVAFAGARALVTMKHVGVNVAADTLFTVAYSGIDGALVLVSADDPGMSSSQNEQDNRRYAVAAGVPMLEPADSQEAYDLTLAGFELSQKWRIPVMLRMTTRVCHGKSILRHRQVKRNGSPTHFERNIPWRVMIPAHARPAHRRLRQKLAEIQQWSEECSLNQVIQGERGLGIIASGVTFLHAREASPAASMLKLGVTYPLPIRLIRQFVAGVDRCLVIEEGDPYLADAIRAAGVRVESKPEMYRFGELNVTRIRRIVAGDVSPEAAPLKGKPPELCAACPYRAPFGVLRKLNCIVAGDIGCYTLGALPPLEAMDTQLCMGASLGVGLGLRHVLPEAEARRVVSVIGDSTFMHSGITGLVEMVYNPPATGHVLLILDNGTTAMTGQQEHPATGRKLGHEPTNRVKIEDVCKAVGVHHVDVMDASVDPAGFEKLLMDRLSRNELSVIISRKPCILAAGKIRKYEQEAQACQECAHEPA
jgi:indolepyruvate ferredoxin oxidoreductase alpha subunit